MDFAGLYCNQFYCDFPRKCNCFYCAFGYIGNIRETVFLAWLKAGYKITASSVSDFKVEDYTFEVGGKNKGHTQVKDVKNAFIVKDDIEYGFKDTVPLWAFGLLY